MPVNISIPNVFANSTGVITTQIDANFNAIASGAASVDGNNRVVQPANLLWDSVGNAGRPASPVAAAFSVPVTGAGGALDPSFFSGLALVQISNTTIVTQASQLITGLNPGNRYKMILNLIQNTTAGDFEIQFNGDTGANYNWASVGCYNAGAPASYVGAGANYIAPLHYSTVYPSVGTYIVIESFFTTKYGDNKTVIINGKGTWYNNQTSAITISDFSGSYVGGSNLSSIAIGTSAGTISGTAILYQLN
jgi:hypothetical protein